MILTYLFTGTVKEKVLGSSLRVSVISFQLLSSFKMLIFWEDPCCSYKNTQKWEIHLKASWPKVEKSDDTCWKWNQAIVHGERLKMNFQVIFQLNGAKCCSLNFPIKGTAWVNRQHINNYAACYQVQFDCLQLCRSDHPEISISTGTFQSCRWTLIPLPGSESMIQFKLLKLLQSFTLWILHLQRDLLKHKCSS